VTLHACRDKKALTNHSNQPRHETIRGSYLAPFLRYDEFEFSDDVRIPKDYHINPCSYFPTISMYVFTIHKHHRRRDIVQRQTDVIP